MSAATTLRARRLPGLLPLLVLPALALNLVTFVGPMLNLAGYAFHESLPGGGIGKAITLATWGELADDPYNWGLLTTTLRLSVEVTLLTLLCAYPIALFVHQAPARWRNLLVVACISPLLVSAVVRTYGWIIILSDGGVVTSILHAIGLTPPRLVFNETGVVVGLVEILMPYMILSLLSGFGRLNPVLEEAAASLGAAPLVVFRDVLLPLTLPGILLGCLLTFVLSVSSFVTPQLLGGGRVNLLATEIYNQAIVTLDWPVAAALSLVVLAVFGTALFAYGRLASAVDRRLG
jgi:putative spermidine/putrescine transport system permease protein